MIDYINILYGKNDFLIEKKLKELIIKTNVDEININFYDLNEHISMDIVEDLRTISFFSEKKIIVVKNLDLVLNQDSNILDTWVKYIEKPNPDVYLFILLKELISESNNLGKSLFNKSYIEEIKDFSKKDYNLYVKDVFNTNNYLIEEDAIDELLERTSYNLDLTTQEIEKLMLYSINEKSINKSLVINLVSRNLEENIYELTNSYLGKNSKKSIEIYYDLLSSNQDPLRIISSLANKIRELIQTKLLIERGSSQDEIAKYLNVKSGVVYYLMKNASVITIEELQEKLKQLSKLDFDIKSGRIDKKIGLEIFILGV